MILLQYYPYKCIFNFFLANESHSKYVYGGGVCDHNYTNAFQKKKKKLLLIGNSCSHVSNALFFCFCFVFSFLQDLKKLHLFSILWWVVTSSTAVRLIKIVIKSRFERARFLNRFIARFFPRPRPPAVCYLNQNASECSMPKWSTRTEQTYTVCAVYFYLTNAWQKNF